MTSPDQHGLPIPNVHYDDHPNDEAMREHAYLEQQSAAVGARDIYRAAIPIDP